MDPVSPQSYPLAPRASPRSLLASRYDTNTTSTMSSPEYARFDTWRSRIIPTDRLGLNAYRREIVDVVLDMNRAGEEQAADLTLTEQRLQATQAQLQSANDEITLIREELVAVNSALANERLTVQSLNRAVAALDNTVAANARRKTQKPPRGPPNVIPENLNIRVRDENNEEIFFLIDRTVQLKKLMDIVIERSGIPRRCARWTYNGGRIAPTDCAANVSLPYATNSEIKIPQLFAECILFYFYADVGTAQHGRWRHN